MAVMKYDVLVIGGGAIGAATLHFLARAGITSTALLERRSAFAQGATGAWGSLLRQYGAIGFYRQHSSKALQYYLEKFESETGRNPGFVNTGALYFIGPSQAPNFGRDLAELRSRSPYTISLLDARQGSAKFPEFQWFDDDQAVYEPQAGMVCPTQITQGWIDCAVGSGAEAKTNSEVTKILTEGGKVTGVVCADGTTYLCERLVLTAGPWTKQILETMGISLPLIARPIQLNRFKNENSDREKGIPFFIDGTTETFGRPMPDGSFLGGYILEETSKDYLHKQPLNIRQAAEAKRRLSKRVKCLRTSTLIGGLRALESYTSEAHPQLGFLETPSNLFVAAGWCCTGFTLAPVFGAEIAQQISRSLDKMKPVELTYAPAK